MRFQWMIVGLAVASLGWGLVHAAEPVKLATVEGFTEYQLENGLKVVIFPEPSKPKVTVNMTILVGSRHEGYGEAGMAHLLEHMLFKPTPSHPKPDQELEARGAKYNGTTWVDRTNYYETLPASDENLEWAIAWEADRLVNCPIKAEDLASEMTVVRNEFEMGENNPGSVLEQRMLATAYEWHNYGKSTIGNRADIERVPVDNLRAFYKKYYRPDNVVLFIGGKLDEAKTLALVQKHFGPLPKPAEPIRSTYTEEPAQDGERIVMLRRVGTVPCVGVAYHIPAASDAEYPAAAILEATLTADKTGRLYKSLVERRLAASVQGTAFAWHDPSMIYIKADVATGNDPNQVLEGMLDTIEDVRSEGVTEVEVNRAKLQFKKFIDQILADTPRLMVEMAEAAAAGDWRLFFLFRDRVESVTLEEVNAVAKKYLQASNRTVGIYVPTQEPQRTPVPAPPDVAAMVKDYAGRKDSAAAEAFDPSPAAIEGRIKRSQFEGIKIGMLPKTNRGQTVVLQLRLRYGATNTLFGKATACDFLPQLMARGTKKLSNAELSDKLDELQSNLHAAGGPGEATFVIQSKRDHLIEVIGLLQQVLREPSLMPSELDLLKQKRVAELEEQLTEPQALGPRYISQKLNPYPEGDVRHQPSLPDELKQAKEIDLASIKNVYETFLSAQAGELVVIGDFDETAVKVAMETALAGWKSKHPFARIPRSADPLPKPETSRINTPDKANAMYFAGLVFPLRDDNPDYPALLVGNEILGGSGFASRLMSRIREKEGLSYGVASMFRSSAFDVRSTFSVYAICNPANAEKVLELAREEMKLMLKKGITESELSDSQDGLIQGQEADRSDDGKLASILANLLFTDRTFDYQAKLDARIRALKCEDVNAAMRRHLAPDNFVNVLAGDFKQ